MFLHSQCIIYVTLILIMTGLGLRSAFILLFSLIFYTLTTYINLFSRLQLRGESKVFLRNFPSNSRTICLGSIWIVVHFAGQTIPFLFYAYYAIYALDTFVPIQGRSGPTMNPEYMMAIITGSTGILLAGHLIPTLCIFRRPAIWMCGFLLVFIIFLILMATPVGFPYRENLSQQRFWIFVRIESYNVLCHRNEKCLSQHTQRQFYNFDRTVRRENSGFFLLPMDRHKNNFVADLMPEFASQTSTADECESEMFCGSPLYMSRMIAQS